MKRLRTRARPVTAALAATGLLAGCASDPRAFSPVLMTTPADLAAFEAAFHQCSADVASGQRDNFQEGRTGSAVGGAALGGAAALATGASAASGAGMLAGPAAAAGLTIGLVVFAPLAIYGVSRARRAENERVVREAMSLCLAEHGHVVDDWALARGEASGLTTPQRFELEEDDAD